MVQNCSARLFAALAGLAVLLPSKARADSLTELWKRPVRATYDSAKNALALEHCIGSAVSDWGFPHVLHGEGLTELWIGNPYAIRISDDGKARKVSFTATAAYDHRIARAIQGCL